MENQNQNKNGKWEVLEVTEANGAKAYAVARRISASEPLSVTNMETHGPTLPKREDAEYIAKNLNLADEAHEHEAAKSGECMDNSEINGNKEFGSCGFRLKITDVATGKVINEEVVSIIMGVDCLASSCKKAVRGDTLNYCCAPLPHVVTTVNRLEEALKGFKSDVVNAALANIGGELFNDIFGKEGEQNG